MEDTAICDKCGKTKPRSQLTLMQEGIGIKFSKHSRVIEKKIRDWVELSTDKKIAWFPRICHDCQNNEYFRQIISGRS